MITLKYMKEFFQPKIEPKIEEKKKEKIKNKEIAELRKSIQELLLQLREKIDKGEYNLIIGEDASGRIPTLIFERILRSVYREKNYPQPEVRFFAGLHGLVDEETLLIDVELTKEIMNNKAGKISEYLNKTIKKIKRETKIQEPKALVCTEYISTGISLKPLSMALEKEYIDFDIATIGTDLESTDLSRTEEYLNGEIFYGQVEVPEIFEYEVSGFSGVEKKPWELFSEPIKKRPIKTPLGGIEKPARIQKTIQEAREDVRILADELIGWYKKAGS